MPTNPLRQRLINSAGFDVDRYAKSKGFPSAAALESVLAAAVALKTTGRIDDKSLSEVLSQYDPAMAPHIRATAKQVNEVAQKYGNYNAEQLLIASVAGPDAIEAGRELVGNFHDATLTSELLSRRTSDDTPMRAKPVEVNSIRANLLREMSPKIDKPKTEVLADALESVADRKETLNLAPSIHTLREHVALAVDDALVTGEAETLIDATELDAGFEPPQP